MAGNKKAPTGTVLAPKAAEAAVHAALKPERTVWLTVDPTDEDISHLPRLQDLLARAMDRGTECRLYLPWDLSLNRNARKTKLPKDFFLAVHPQADMGDATITDDDTDPDYVPDDESHAIQPSRHAPRSSRNPDPHYREGGRRRTPATPAVHGAADPVVLATIGATVSGATKPNAGIPASTPPNSTASTTSTTSTTSTGSTDSSVMQETDSEKLRRRRRYPDFAVVATQLRSAVTKGQSSGSSTPRTATLRTTQPEGQQATSKAKSEGGSTQQQSDNGDPPRKSQAPHSLVEVKRLPPDNDAMNSVMQRSVMLLAIFRRSQRQLLEQGVCTFQEYPFLKVIHCFFVVGPWVRHFTFDRDSMPHSLEEIELESAKKSLPKFFNAFKGLKQPVYPLILTKADGTIGYSPAFRKDWEEATESIIAQFISTF